MRALLSTIAFGAFAAVFAPAFAAEDGALGGTSTGTVSVFLTLPEAPPRQVQISGLQDFVFAPVRDGLGDSEIGGGISICVFHTSPTFLIRANQINGPAFNLVGDQESIPFLFSFFLGSPFPGVIGPGGTGGLVANRQSADYSVGPRQFLNVLLPLTDPSLAQRPAGLYTALLQVTVAVE